MKISYAITVCNEIVEIQQLVSMLLSTKRAEDEIVILYDSKGGIEPVEEYLRAKSVNAEFSWHKGEFEGHFADWKNKLTSYCSGDYIFQIDADEIPDAYLIKALPFIIKENMKVDVYLTPRINTVEGLQENHIKKWGWNVNEDGWVNWPDYQWRIWRNVPEIKWINKVHEQLSGYTTWTALPRQSEYSLKHPKTIERQERQNALYDNLLSTNNHYKSEELKNFYTAPTNKLMNIVLPLLNLIFIFNEVSQYI
tara:strand:- start:4594 stop:5349 length:756 start_codon:yes stop_codon:yes gene_type:complete